MSLREKQAKFTNLSRQTCKSIQRDTLEYVLEWIEKTQVEEDNSDPHYQMLQGWNNALDKLAMQIRGEIASLTDPKLNQP